MQQRDQPTVEERDIEKRSGCVIALSGGEIGAEQLQEPIAGSQEPATPADSLGGTA